MKPSDPTTIIEDQTVIFRADYKSRKEYLADYRALTWVYDYKVRVEGGWHFFLFADDVKTWKNQK